jgi:hypothetical protein
MVFATVSFINPNLKFVGMNESQILANKSCKVRYSFKFQCHLQILALCGSEVQLIVL